MLVRPPLTAMRPSVRIPASRSVRVGKKIHVASSGTTSVTWCGTWLKTAAKNYVVRNLAIVREEWICERCLRNSAIPGIAFEMDAPSERGACDLVDFVCKCGGEGAQAVEQRNDDGWFITMGHAGFNSRANNRFGYKDESNARRAIAMYEARGRQARGEIAR